MSDMLFRRPPDRNRVPLPRWGLRDLPLLVSDISLYRVDFERRGRLGACQQAPEAPGHRLARAQAGQAFSWWAGMSATERAATIDRLKESPTVGEARAEVKRKAKKTPRK